MRIQRKRIREKHDRWLVSYADFITLLFAFFVVMFAASQVNQERVQWIAKVYAAHLRGNDDIVVPPLPPSSDKETDTEEMSAAMAELLPIKNKLEEKLAPMIEAGKIAMNLHRRGLVLSLREAAFFPVGKATFLTGAEELLRQIGMAIQSVPDLPIRLEGHTDDVPIHNEQFASNWELSSWRAIEVMKLLTTRFDISPERISVVGYGALRPIATNDTPEGRRKNRRVDIVILSRAAAARGPQQSLHNPLTTSKLKNLNNGR